MGTFGVFAYAIFSSLFIIAKALVSISPFIKSMLYLSLALISFLSILQMAFLGAGGATNFAGYIGDVYALQTSVGGVFIALNLPYYDVIKSSRRICFLYYNFNYVGFYYRFCQKTKFFKKISDRTMVNFNKIDKNNPVYNQPKISKKEAKNLKKQSISLSLNTNKSVSKSLDTPIFDTFEDKRNNYYENEVEEDNSRFLPKTFNPIFEEKQNIDSRRPPKIVHNDYNEGFSSKKPTINITDDETRQKNLEFLRATMINKNHITNSIKGTNVKNPNEEFSTSYLNNKIAERLNKSAHDEPIIEDIDAKFEADLKKVEIKPINKVNNIFDKKDNTSYNKIEPIKKTEYNELIIETKRPKNIISGFEQMEISPTRMPAEEVMPRYKRPSRYVRPPMGLLSTISTNIEDYADDYLEKSQQLERVLNEFRVPAKVIAVTRGPAVTRYELQMPAGVSVKKITQHAEDIAMTLASNGAVRIEAPIPGKNAVGVEVPNNTIATIALKDIIESREFIKSKSHLSFCLGKDISGNSKICDLAKMPHLLVAGATGSGKSVCLNSLIISLLYKSSPEDLRLILIDPKRVEFYVYNGLPHLMLPDVITEADKAINAFNWAINEMERRFQLFQDTNVKNLAEYNALPEILNGTKPKMPMIVIIVDELADLMLTNKRDVEDKIMRIAAKARAAGIHLVLATQRPSVDVITGTIKANLPSRIAFSVTSFADSKTILDGGGADKLLGKGDMLYAPIDYPEAKRIQGAFVSNDEVKAIVEFIKQNNKAYFDEEIEQVINQKISNNGFVNGSYENEVDELLQPALKLIIESGQASISMLQRRFAIGYARAARIIDQMELMKYVSPSDGSKARNVYITMEKI